MSLPKINPTHTPSWTALKEHYRMVHTQKMQDWFAADTDRAQKFQLHYEHFLIDYSKNRITEETMRLLFSLAEETHLREAIEQQFAGDFINETEGRRVLHTALRRKNKPTEVRETLKRMKAFSLAVIQGKHTGFTGKKITDIVNIGIGGSDLGPRMAVDALQFYRNHLRLHFVSNVDGDQSAEILKELHPETTLVIVVSKSFGTLETLSNAAVFKDWFLKKGGRESDLTQHFAAVSSNVDKAQLFGIAKENIFPMWDWVGGRFSLWSAAGLSLCCAIGFENFKAFLNGAQQMDEHFKNADFKENIPVILGLLSIWYRNFFGVESEAVIPYTHYLEKFVPYLQQAVMESNGKNTDRNGKKVSYQTGSIIWGATGTNAQHAFFQLIHQGTLLVPCDFIGFKKPLNNNRAHHDQLMANFFAQTEALLRGKPKDEVWKELKNIPEEKAVKLLPFKVFEGNKPSTTLLIEQLTPESLGSLIALYEHKIFVQGAIWNIFSYDQWGVELGKQLTDTILKQFKTQKALKDYDSSTESLLKYYQTS